MDRSEDTRSLWETDKPRLARVGDPVTKDDGEILKYMLRKNMQEKQIFQDFSIVR